MVSLGHYDDVLTRTGAGWRIAARRYTTVRTTFLGPLRMLPSRLCTRLAGLGARKLLATTTEGR